MMTTVQKFAHPLPLPYRPELTPGDTVGILRSVKENIRHLLPVSLRLRKGNRVDITGIICELSKLGGWVQRGKLWYYCTTDGDEDFIGAPPSVLVWSGLSLADMEYLQHSCDFVQKKKFTAGGRRKIIEDAIDCIIAKYESENLAT